MRKILGLLLSVICFASSDSTLQAQSFLAVDQDAWPGNILTIRASDPATELYWQRGRTNADHVVPKIQSLTSLRDGSIAFCSGLDRSLHVLGSNGERELHYGGSLVRQVRSDASGDLYWSGLETPIDNNPLPDGFIFRKRAATGQAETLLTFSQGLVDKDWWGAFDVREGEIFVATRKSPAKLYKIENSIPRLVSTLPVAVAAFRFESAASLLAADGNGKIYRFADILSHPDRFEIVAERPLKLVDFLVIP